MDPNLIRQLQANASAPVPRTGRAVWRNGQFILPDEQQIKPQGRGGFLTSLISEAGGTGGALGGAAAGAAAGSIVPGIGTAIGGVIGAGLGGFLGGAGGRLAENKIRDDRYGLGQALMEGGMSGAFGALGTGVQAIKGAKALTAVDDIAKGTGAAGKLTKGASGLRVDKNVGDIGELDEVVKLFQKHKIMGTPETQLRKIDATMGKLGSQVDDMLAKKPVPIDKGVAARIQQMVDDPLQLTDLDMTPQGRQVLQGYLDEAAKFGDARDLNKLVQKINPTARRAFNKMNMGTQLTAKEQAAYAFKQAGDDVLQEIAPGIKATKKEMALLFKYNPQVAKYSEQGFNFPFAGKLTKGVAEPFRSAQSRVGVGLAGTSNALSRPAVKTTAKFAKGMAARGVGNQIMGTGAPVDDYSMNNPTNQDMTQPMSMNTMMPANSSTMMDSSYNSTDPLSNALTSQSPYSKQNLLADIQRDPTNAEDYIKHYAMLDEIFNPAQESASQKPLSQGQQERVDLMQALTNTENVMAGGSINYGPIGARVEGVKSFFNAADPETLTFKNTVSGLRAAITKARAGASLTEGELKMLAKYTPSETDTEQVVRSKLNALRQLYGYQAPTGGATLEDALMGQQVY